MNKTKIEWADMVWNPVSGCSKISAGCKNCYAERHANRFWGARKFTDVRIHPEKWGEPLKRKRPSIIFVNSMSDLFHEDVPNFFIYWVFEVIAKWPQHVFLVLTKRPERMYGVDMPNLPNLWVGVSIEDQETADRRIPALIASYPDSRRFISCEPLLSPVDITYWLKAFPLPDTLDAPDPIQWVIVGGESGPNARPMHPDWARSIRDQCAEAKIPFFFKQWGEWISSRDVPSSHADTYSSKTRGSRHPGRNLNGEIMVRVGKRVAGHLIDGCEYLEFPSVIKKIKGE